MKIFKNLTILTFLLFLTSGLVFAAGVDDLLAVLRSWGLTGTRAEDINKDQKVNTLDAGLVIRDWGESPSPQPTTPSSTNEWVQFGHDPQRTNYTPQAVSTPWNFKWQWNGSDPDGKKQANHISLPELVQPITGGGLVYIAAGNKGIYALNSNNGNVVWNRNPGGSIDATPTYDTTSGWLFALSTNGILYKLNAQTGETLSQFNTNTSSIKVVAPLLLTDRVVIATGSKLHAVKKENMQSIWSYDAGANIVTTAAYSTSRNRIIFGTNDLYIHIVNNNNGQLAYKLKPTPRSPGNPGSSSRNNLAELVGGWPVVAEQHGIVFVRYRLDWDTLWTWNPFPKTNQEIRNNLTNNPGQQALFAINLDNGSIAFIPAVGNSGQGDGGYLEMGPLPIIANIDNKELAYIVWRNGLTCASQGWCDGREDATMGEMVLDNNTVSGYQAGDVRFVRFQDIQTDEAIKITMSGKTIFHSHWLINAAAEITDRSSSLGGTFTNPIKTKDAPFVIWRQCSCYPNSPGSCRTPCGFPGCNEQPLCYSNCQFDTQTHYCSQGLYSYGDNRSYPPGFYEYFNDFEQETWSVPFTVVSNNLVLVKTGDGGILALGK